MIDSGEAEYHHPRTDQGFHGRLGGMKGNCNEAKTQGRKGARSGKYGGAASKGKVMAKTNFLINLELVTQFVSTMILGSWLTVTYPILVMMDCQIMQLWLCGSICLVSFTNWRRQECAKSYAGSCWLRKSV